MERKNRKLWVAFSGKTDIWYLRFLKNNFRHCFIILDDTDHWIIIDPLSAHTEIELISKRINKGNLPDWFSESGFKVIESEFFPKYSKIAPVSFLNCVETVKRIIGIHKFFIFTPYQLYKFLDKNNRKDF